MERSKSPWDSDLRVREYSSVSAPVRVVRPSVKSVPSKPSNEYGMSIRRPPCAFTIRVISVEAGEHVVVEGDPREVLDRGDHPLRPALGEGDVDLVRPPARDRDVGVARDADQGRAPGPRVDPEDVDRVAEPVLQRRARARVAAEDQDEDRLVSPGATARTPRGRRRSASGGSSRPASPAASPRRVPRRPLRASRRPRSTGAASPGRPRGGRRGGLDVLTVHLVREDSSTRRRPGGGRTSRRSRPGSRSRRPFPWRSARNSTSATADTGASFPSVRTEPMRVPLVGSSDSKSSFAVGPSVRTSSSEFRARGRATLEQFEGRLVVAPRAPDPRTPGK